MKRSLRLLLILVSAVVVTLLLVWSAKTPFVHMHVLDVGQGDALLLETTNGQQMLIDGGPDNTALDQLGRVMPFFDRSLDIVLMTHPDSDHATGLVEVVRRYRVGRFVMTGVVKHSATYATLLEELRQHDVPVQYVHGGDRLDFSDGSTFSIFSPAASWQGREAKKANNTSVVGQFRYRDFSMLFTGDIEAEVEREMTSSAFPLSSTILKVPHHGSHTSSSQEFLHAVKPKAAVISVGQDNGYGHPHDDVLARYAALGIPVHRTDQEGAFEIQSDGTSFRFHRGSWFRMW